MMMMTTAFFGKMELLMFLQAWPGNILLCCCLLEIALLETLT